MKIIDWKVYKEIELDSLSKEELIKIIEDLQKELDKPEKPSSFPYYPPWRKGINPMSIPDDYWKLDPYPITCLK